MMVSGLESAKHKLARIAIHLDEINALIRELVQNRNTYEVVKDTDGKEKLHFLVGAPRDIQVIVGEVIYQFKSALDHLVFQLVQSNPTNIPLPKDWERDCQFPLCLEVPKHGNPAIPYTLPVPYEFFEKKLPGISKAAYAFIEGIQPYRSGPGTHNILRIIGKLANIDKHRHLHVLLPRASVHYDVVYSDGIRGTTTMGGLEHGAEVPIFEEIGDNPTVKMNRSFTAYITFDETIGEGPDTVETENLLQVCLEQFELVIIPTFEQILHNP